MAHSGRKPERRPTLGLVLTGGGARAAYQVGVLSALAQLLPKGRNPFPVIVGTSAGAVAASVLASEAYRWRRAVAALGSVWANFRSDQVFMVDPPHMLRAGAHWILALLSGGMVLNPPRALLDNTPLGQLLGRHIEWQGVRTSIDRGHLRGVALSATCYQTGQSTAFYDGVPEIKDWARIQRQGVRTDLELDHLMASTALPMLFPPVRLGNTWFGDGAMRQLNPLSPAIHLGADRLLIIGVRARSDAGVTPGPMEMPAAGQIFGFMLDTLFTDQLYADLEQTDRFNQLAREPGSHGAEGRPLRHVDTLIVAPSEDPRAIAARHLAQMPSGLRGLLRILGSRGDASGSQLASYLMFESVFTRDLMDLGFRDAMRERDVLLGFIRGEPVKREAMAV